MSGGIELAALIGALRVELQTAINEGRDSELRFQVGPVELELSVAIENSVDAKAGVKFWVIEAGGGGSRANTQTQRIMVTLTPHHGGHPVDVADDAVHGED